MTASAAQSSLPLWLRGTTRRPVERRAVGPRDWQWWVGVVCLTLAILLLSFVGHVTVFGWFQETQTQGQLYQTLRGTLANATTPLGELDLNKKVVADGTPVAYLKIPSISVTQVIVQGTTSEDLRDGPGHRRDTVMPGQSGTSVIFGRQSTYGGPFGNLASLVPGDRFTVTTGQGTSTFRVFGLRRPGDRVPVAPKADEGRVELVTADGPPLLGNGTLYVDAELVGKTKETPDAVFGLLALNQGEGAMQTDQTQLLPFLFGLQWLAVATALCFWLFRKWGRWQTWIVGAPVLLVLAATTADAAVGLLPNLL
jgi:LPXTG-site transpeptidase (sortase) family protein